jgi:glutamyl-tRNA synthetase
MKKNRLRFAPSPTGFVHLGSLRTILFTYLMAKQLQADLILRIEDTDQNRLVKDSLANLLEVLQWLKIDFDEGPHLGGPYGPYIQSERLEIYKKQAHSLIESDKAYPCFCLSERLAILKEEQIKNKLAPKYDNHCRNLNREEAKKRIKAGEKYVIRQKMPLEGDIIVKDELRGEIKFSAKDLEDQVLLKSDGFPTYQLASVIDDHLMEISHVTRGEEWIPSLPKNVLLYQALNFQLPKFIHLPLILNKEGGKLSKRQGDVYVENYKQKGYLPEALINFCALLGWHSKDDREIFSLSELIKEFNYKWISTSPAIFDLDKLKYFNSYYIKQKSNQDLTQLIEDYLPNHNLDVNKLIPLLKERLEYFSQIPQLFHFFFEDINYDKSLLLWKKLDYASIKENLEELLKLLKETDDFSLENLEAKIINYLKENNKKNGDYLWPLRVALSGEKFSPSPFELASVLGKEETIKRIYKALEMC